MVRHLPRALAVACALILARAPARADATLDRIKRDHTVRIGITDAYPTSFRNPDGSMAGGEWDVAQAFFSSIGVEKLEPVVLEWSGIVPALKAHRIDAIVSSIYIKPERCTQIAFSRPDLMVSNFLVVQKGNPKAIHSFGDVARNPALTVTAIQGGGSALTVKQTGIPAAQTHLMPGYTEMLAELISGRVDAAAMDDNSATHFMAADPDAVERPQPFETPMLDGKPLRNFSAIGLRLEDTDLRAALDGFLDHFIGSPAHLAILAKYHMSAEAVPPHDLTAAQLCQP